MAASLAVAIAASPSALSASVNCMFDWPETIQTSPTSTSPSVIVLLPEIVIVPGVALAGIELSVTCHLPSDPAFVFRV